MSSGDPILLDVFADIACPWCFIGHRRLTAARAAWDEREDVPPLAVRHRAFQLQPDVPPDGEPAAAFYARRFGSPDQAAAIFARVREAGAEDGIAFAFEEMPKAANTHLAHRAVALARDQGAQDAALDALYAAYFVRALDVTDAATIVAVLSEAGLPDPGALAEGLAADGGVQATAADLGLGRELEVSAVPLVVGDGRFGLPGAQPAEMLERFLEHVRQARTPA